MFVNKYQMIDLSDVQKHQGRTFTVDVDYSFRCFEVSVLQRIKSSLVLKASYCCNLLCI